MIPPMVLWSGFPDNKVTNIQDFLVGAEPPKYKPGYLTRAQSHRLLTIEANTYGVRDQFYGRMGYGPQDYTRNYLYKILVDQAWGLAGPQCRDALGVINAMDPDCYQSIRDSHDYYIMALANYLRS
jgi:hypothetical protein